MNFDQLIVVVDFVGSKHRRRLVKHQKKIKKKKSIQQNQRDYADIWLHHNAEKTTLYKQSQTVKE